MKVISLLLLLLGCASHHDLSDDPVSGPLVARRESFRQCYHESEVYLGKDKPPTGTVKVNFLITGEGKVKHEKIKESTFPKDPNFHACILHQVRMIHFPKIKSETEVIQALDFFPR